MPRKRRKAKQLASRPPTGLGSTAPMAAAGRARRGSAARTWLFRLLAMTLVPAVFFLGLELVLRVLGYGYPTTFFLKLGDRDAYTTNSQFGWRFFPPAIARAPALSEFPAKKAAGTYRIFVLGESAAMGIPEPAFGLSRMLQVMLRLRFPQTRFEVVNAAMTAINSHVVLPVAQECAGHQADLFVVYMGNNEFVGPFGPATALQPFSAHLPLVQASILLKSTRTSELLEDLLGRVTLPRCPAAVARHGAVCRQPRGAGRPAEGPGLQPFPQQSSRPPARGREVADRRRPLHRGREPARYGPLRLDAPRCA